MYMHLMEEGPKLEEKIREKVKIKEAIKKLKRRKTTQTK